MDNISENTLFSLHPDIMYTLIDEEAVIMGVEDDALYGLNDVGTEILKYLETNKTMSVQSLADNLAEIFEVDKATSLADTKTFLKSMLTENLVIPAE